MSLDPTIVNAAEILGIGDQLEHLRQAAVWSERKIEEARAAVGTVEVGGFKVDVVLLGSYARREATASSDYDYLVIPHELPKPEMMQATRDLLRAMDGFIENVNTFSAEEPPEPGAKSDLRPGGSGLFGKIQSAPDLVERIGLEQDTNTTHTRRSLLLQESKSIFNEELHADLVKSILARYLIDYTDKTKNGPPRFLINDLNRYWSTVAVDYQAKRWERLEKGWRVRYLKLLVSRRLSYFSAVIPLLLCSDESPAEVERLYGVYSKPALARIAALAENDAFAERDQLRTVLLIADEFVELLASGANRLQLDSDDEPNELFDAMKARTEMLDAALREIVFGTLLGPAARTYLVL